MTSTPAPRSDYPGGPPPGAPRDVVILGSTGSIGTQALDLVRRNPDRFRVVALAAGGGNPGLLARQAVEFGVRAVAVASPAAAESVRAALADFAQTGPAQTGPTPVVTAGPDAVTELAACQCDVVLNGVDGAAGLRATLAALEAG
ncbi:MAG TPA: 1-deoxy-D-xylulose-5-phosphate reductoisomerase, partial [Trebonia sp.]